jgi:hydroxymethylglutaryl-CoA lyase
MEELLNKYLNKIVDKIKIKEVLVRELGPREGFQMEKQFVDTSIKIDFINKLSDTGLKYIEVTSFVNPKWVPNLADAEEVLKNINKKEGVIYGALVLNSKGVDRAINLVKYLNTTIFADENINLKNNNKTIKESLKEAEDIIKKCQDNNIVLEGGISAVWGSPLNQEIPLNNILMILDFWVKNGIKNIMLADTTGEANYITTKAVLAILKDKYPQTNFIMHFHDSRGLGLINVLASLEEGVNVFDSSVAGLGGCPFAPNSVGNICTEDLVYLLNTLNIKTNINLEKLISCALYIENILNKKLPGRIKDLYKNLENFNLLKL